MKVIVYTRTDGGVNVVHPAPQAGKTEDEVLSELQVKVVPQSARNVAIINESDLPVDRELRDNWRQSGPLPPVVDRTLPLPASNRNARRTAFDAANNIVALKAALKDILGL